MIGADLAVLILQLAQVGLLSGIFLRLGMMGANQKNHGHRIRRLEKKVFPQHG